MNRYGYLLLLTVNFLGFGICYSQTEKVPNTLFWRISGKDCKEASYLYGTFHLMCKDDILISDSLKSVIRNCDEVYFEVDMDDPGVSMKLMNGMQMKDSLTLNKMLSPEDFSKVEKFFKDSLSTNINPYLRFKPLFFATLLVSKFLDCKIKSGIDQEILKLTRKFKKPVNGLETVEFQASVFDMIPYEIQAEELLKSLDSLEKGRADFQKMVTAYKNQDLNLLQGMSDMEDFGFEKAKEFLLNQRNRNWVLRMKEILPSKTSLFAIGAGHLTGTEGLIRLLRKEGYEVEPVLIF
jgi:uncharacterized protein YbaP (TraB family)